MRITTANPSILPKSRAPVSFMRPEEVDRLCLASQERADQASQTYHKELARRSLERGLFGGVLGAALLGGAYNVPHGFLIGPLFGAGVGLYTAWEGLHRQQTGHVTVELDSQVYQKPFQGHPRQVALTPQEAHFQLLAQGGASPGRVRAHRGALPEAPPQALVAWKEQAAPMRHLAEQRRLVASFGDQTEDGQPVVQLVDAVAAATLASQGARVYVVNAQAPEDVEHSLSMVGFNVAHSQSNSEEYRYLEREVEYSLVPVRLPEDVAQVQAPGLGVPEGMFGLLENASRYAEVVNSGQQMASGETDSPEFGTRPIRHSDRTSFTENLRLQDRNLNFQGGLTTRHRINLPALLALGGTTAGLMAAMAFTGPGVPGPALMAATVGFLGGRALGRALID
ncbi:hypothetical protein IV102_13955 [bacterium]|nr:hypothetical protein [bacterium]